MFNPEMETLPREELEKLQEDIVTEHGYKLVRHVHQLFVKPIKK